MNLGISQIIAFGSEIQVDKGVPPGRVLSGLGKGQIVEAEVVRSISPRQVLLKMKGKTFSAHTCIPFKPGQKISLRVTHTGSRPRFQYVETRGGSFLQLPPDCFSDFRRLCPYGALGKLLRNLKSQPETPLARAVLISIERLVKAIAPESDVADPDRTRGFIRKSGLTWEHKLLSVIEAKRSLPQPFLQRFIEGDLKGLSLLLMQNAEKEDFGGINDLHLLLENIERLQVLNHHASKESGRFLVPVPVLFDRDIRFGQMLVDVGSRSSGPGEDRIIRVSLLLEMSGLGNLQVDLSILKGAITGLFSVEDDSSRLLIESQMPHLLERLQKSGFIVHDMSCRTVGPEALSSASLADRMIEDHPGVLSILV
jgi:hypothetical protein